MLTHLAAVALASALTAAVLSGAGELIIFGRAPSPTPAVVTGPVTVVVPAAAPATEAPPATTAAPTPEAAPSAEVPATALPSPTVAPLSLTPFRFQGRSYLGIVSADAQSLFVAPFAGAVEVRLYQFIEGDVRVGSNVPSLPFFPYVSVIAKDRRITYRPGAVGAVTELLVRDGARVAAGDPLFRVEGEGRSSWATFYDARAPYQVVVSLQSVPGGRDLDAAAYFAAP